MWNRHLILCDMRRITRSSESAGTMADRALLLDENQALFAQNNEKRTRSTRHIVVGSAKVRSDDNILAVQAKRDARDTNRAKTESSTGQRPTSHSRFKSLD